MQYVLDLGFVDDVAYMLTAVEVIPDKLSVGQRDMLYNCIGGILGDPVTRERHKEACLPWVFALVQNGLTQTLSRSTHSQLLVSLKQLMDGGANLDSAASNNARNHNTRGVFSGNASY